MGENGAVYIAQELISRGVSLEFIQDEGMVIIDDLFSGLTIPIATYVSSLYIDIDILCMCWNIVAKYILSFS